MTEGVESPEQRFGRIVRWMRDNVLLVSGVYRTTDRRLSLNPGLALDPRCAVVLSGREWPRDRVDWMLNSTTGLVCCCYIDQLGKVMTLWKGGSHDEQRAFKKFADRLPGFRSESDQGKGRLGELYGMYRNGFVHHFAPGEGRWCREEDRIYWCGKHGDRPCVNVDQLAHGFLEALDAFESEFRKEAATSDALYSQFTVWLQTRLGSGKKHCLLRRIGGALWPRKGRRRP
jgi:hypothetical protein